jgi:hypothetical protein
MRRCIELALVLVAALAPFFAVRAWRYEQQLAEVKAEIAATSAMCTAPASAASAALPALRLKSTGSI